MNSGSDWFNPYLPFRPWNLSMLHLNANVLESDYLKLLPKVSRNSFKKSPFIETFKRKNRFQISKKKISISYSLNVNINMQRIIFYRVKKRENLFNINNSIFFFRMHSRQHKIFTHKHINICAGIHTMSIYISIKLLFF